MKKSLKKVKNFVEKHHKIITHVAAGSVVVGSALLLCAISKKKTPNIVECLTPENIPVPKELGEKFGVNCIEEYTGAIELISEYKAVTADLGEFGKALCEIPSITPNSEVFILVNAKKTGS